MSIHRAERYEALYRLLLLHHNKLGRADIVTSRIIQHHYACDWHARHENIRSLYLELHGGNASNLYFEYCARLGVYVGYSFDMMADDIGDYILRIRTADRGFQKIVDYEGFSSRTLNTNHVKTPGGPWTTLTEALQALATLAEAERNNLYERNSSH